ncbi:hypothetical protein PoB_006690400 [Plakobranchus ocellatus]|uniref:Uncharacterized protein n=1 Tax=Plakobranchus ocellatus TaxID=259542 RepID=A0AAV4D888_9GAST|nr:hypothetical protein PoB_006690400 [Plakobranchus ocellatus]
MVNLDLQNKRLACQSYNRTYIEGFDITDMSELFIVSVPKDKKKPGFHFFDNALIWIAVALIVFVLVQQITNFTSSSTVAEGGSDRRRMKILMKHGTRSPIENPKTSIQNVPKYYNNNNNKNNNNNSINNNNSNNNNNNTKNNNNNSNNNNNNNKQQQQHQQQRQQPVKATSHDQPFRV